jgi:glycine/D-amino acid oxidase-like deaminating enzyme/nitrite reductase/ring-hydroxylating ferredoxin subunit
MNEPTGTSTVSVWNADASPWQPTAGEPPSSVDVVIAGAGITGLTTALLLARAGKRVLVLERREIGAGATGNTTAKVTALHGLTYAALVDGVGEDDARRYADANMAGVAEVRALAGELAPDCQLTEASAYTFAWKQEKLDDLRREVEVGRQLGMPLAMDDAAELPFEVAGAVRLDGQLHLHATKYLAGLARGVEMAGGSIVDHAPVTGYDDGADGVDVHTSIGSFHADHLVSATLLPVADIGGVFAKAEASRSYALAAVLEAPQFEGMYISTDAPTRSVRPLVLDGRPALVASGPSHKPGAEHDTDRFHRELEDWVRATFPVVDVPYRWSAQDYVTADRVPYVGRCPRTHNTFVATGFRKWGLSNGTAAAIMLRDLLTEQPNPWFAAFDATRLPDAGDVIHLTSVNVGVAGHLIGDRLGRLSAPALADLDVGEGGLVDVDGDTVGAYREEDGTVVAVGLNCTHLGCTVQWNSAERSWDCPCHGSRFDRHGEVLEGPALEPLTVRVIRPVP